MNRIASSVFEVGKNISGNSEQLTGTVQAVTVNVLQNGDWKVVYRFKVANFIIFTSVTHGYIWAIIKVSRDLSRNILGREMENH